MNASIATELTPTEATTAEFKKDATAIVGSGAIHAAELTLAASTATGLAKPALPQSDNGSSNCRNKSNSDKIWLGDAANDGELASGSEQLGQGSKLENWLELALQTADEHRFRQFTEQHTAAIELVDLGRLTLMLDKHKPLAAILRPRLSEQCANPATLDNFIDSASQSRTSNAPRYFIAADCNSTKKSPLPSSRLPTGLALRIALLRGQRQLGKLPEALQGLAQACYAPLSRAVNVLRGKQGCAPSNQPAVDAYRGQYHAQYHAQGRQYRSVVWHSIRLAGDSGAAAANH